MMYGPNDVPYEETLEAAWAVRNIGPGYWDRQAAVTALVEMCQTLDEAGEFVADRAAEWKWYEMGYDDGYDDGYEYAVEEEAE